MNIATYVSFKKLGLRLNEYTHDMSRSEVEPYAWIHFLTDTGMLEKRHMKSIPKKKELDVIKFKLKCILSSTEVFY